MPPMLSINNAFTSIKTGTERLFNHPQIEEERIATASRERLIDLISGFPDTDRMLREELRSRFGNALKKELHENLDWLEIQNLFELAFSNSSLWSKEEEMAYNTLSQQLDCSIEMVKEAMKCVGMGMSMEDQKEAKF